MLYAKMNAFAVSCLLAVGATAQSFRPGPSSAAAVTSYLTTTAPHTHHHNNTTALWSYFNTTVTSVMVVQTLTTMCSEATTLTFNGHPYTATAGQLVVVTNCPCTVTTAIPTMTSSLCMPPVTALTLPIPPHSTPTPTASMPMQVSSIPGAQATMPMVHVGSASLAGRDLLSGLLASAAVVVILGL
ncbi:hypothetical protein F4861DRAFT_144023 [Xylaria intraflava]|nr:hypothetical protein F4861DRAFT_144023 [Xylaria intraflava]